MTPDLIRYQNQYHMHSQAAFGGYRRIPSMSDKAERHPFVRHQQHSPHQHSRQQSPPAVDYNQQNQPHNNSHDSNSKTSPVKTPPPLPLSRSSSADRLLGRSKEIKSSTIGVEESSRSYGNGSSSRSSLINGKLASSSPETGLELATTRELITATKTTSLTPSTMSSSMSENKVMRNEDHKNIRNRSDHKLHHSHQHHLHRDHHQNLLYRPYTKHNLPCPCRSCYLKYLEVAFTSEHRDMKYHHRRRRNHYRLYHRHDENSHRRVEDHGDLDDEELIWLDHHHQHMRGPLMPAKSPSMMMDGMTSPRISPDLGKVKIEGSSTSIIEQSSSLEDGDDRDEEEKDNSIE